MVGLALAVFVGCGPVEYLAQVSGRASAALAQAHRAGGDAHAPYEYTMASEYLRKAREDAGRSHYQTSLDYGRKAEEFAHRALAITREKNAKKNTGLDAEEPPVRRTREGVR